MQTDTFHGVKVNSLIRLYLLIVSTRLILIVDATKTTTQTPDRQMCTRIQSMLSYGKYQTYQMSSNVTYVSRVYTQSFLTYSPLDDVLIFIEPKHQLHVYNAQTIHLIVNLTAANVVYVTSLPSLTVNNRHDLFFVSESRLTRDRVSLHVCQVRFDRFQLKFDEKKCIQTLIINCDKPDIRINGFTIKRNHAGTKKSLLFVSTNIGLVYAIFDTTTGSLIRQPIVLNDTLNEGSVVVTSSGIIYYANKQEHTIHEICVKRDFRIRYGKIIKSNAIRLPFGLITDECGHLYIATKSMILVMFIPKYSTIRSVFSKASDLSISIERLNSTTYVYATVKKQRKKTSPVWMFNFLSFNEPERTTLASTRAPVVKITRKFEFASKETSAYSLLSTMTGTTLPSAREMSEQPSNEYPTSALLNELQSATQSSSDDQTSSKTVPATITLSKLLTPESDFISDFPTTQSLPLDKETSIQTTSRQLSSSDVSPAARSTTYPTKLTEIVEPDNDLKTSESNVQNSTSVSLRTTMNIISAGTYDDVRIVPDNDPTVIDTTISPTDVSNIYSQFSTVVTQKTTKEQLTLASSLSTDVSTEYLYSTISTSTLLETMLRSKSDYTLETTVLRFSTPFDQPTNLEDINDIESSSIINRATSTLSTQEYFSSALAEVDVSSTLHSSSPSELSSTGLASSLSSHAPFLLHSSPAQSITTSTKLNLLLSSNSFSVTTIATTLIVSTIFSSSISTPETTDSLTTLDTTDQSSMTTFFDQSSSSLLTSYPDDTSSLPYTISSAVTSTEYATFSTAVGSTTMPDSTTTIQTDEPSTLLFETTDSKKDLTTIQTEESSTLLFETTEVEKDLITTDSLPSETASIFSTIEEHSSEYTSTQTSSETVLPFSSTEEHSSEYISIETSSDATPISSITDEHSSQYTLTETSPDTTLIFLTTEEHSSEYISIETSSYTTPASSTTEEHSNQYASTETSSETTLVFSTPEEHVNEYSSTQASLELTSTIIPDTHTVRMEQSTLVVFPSKPQPPRPPRRRTRKSTTTTTAQVRQNQKEKITRQTSPSSTISMTTASTSEMVMTSPYRQPLTFSPVSIWRTKWNSLRPEQQITIIKPTSNTLLSNDLLQSLFNRTSNSSNEKVILIDLADLPPSTWNISLHTNDSILLDIVLPPPSQSSDLHATTNLTINNIEANRFSTSIVGFPVNLQVDQIQTKQFSLAMNLTNDQFTQSTSDIVIGHIKSEQFELNITKSDNMNLHVQQVDSETAELFFDGQFCTNESSLQINLNLSKNGTIRYGNRSPIRIGSVFTRVHMLKQSCDLEQPFALFFDICEGQNPCLNGGTCRSQTPNYDDPFFSQQDSSQINYQCLCPVRISGEHCQYVEFPFAYCINGGILLSTINASNQTTDECSCASGFRGVHCEENIDNCMDIHCSKHGICEDGINEYTCSCFDGFYGSDCENTNVKTVVLQVVSKSFATVAILLIAAIAGLFVASDIHTYLTTRKKKSPYRLDKLTRAASEVFENSVLLLGFGDAPMEMSDISSLDRSRGRTMPVKRLPKKRKSQVRFHQLAKRRYTKTLEKPPSNKRRLLSDSFYETIL